jgi:hypothetical protein
MRDRDFFKEILKQGVHFFVIRYPIGIGNNTKIHPIRSLEREKLAEAERMQALKMIRKITEIDATVRVEF